MYKRDQWYFLCYDDDVVDGVCVCVQDLEGIRVRNTCVIGTKKLQLEDLVIGGGSKPSGQQL